MEEFTQNNFKEMRWKNGGGTTTELYSLYDPFVFRLSIANVEKDGDFSIFPFIDRTLILLSGDGFLLHKPRESLQLNTKFNPFEFSGDDNIHCSLLGDNCTDFNVMVDRRWGKTVTRIMERNIKLNIFANNIDTFIFDYSLYTLWKITGNEQMEFDINPTTPLVVIGVYEN
jgi:environmental stress-induced protein Ves